MLPVVALDCTADKMRICNAEKPDHARALASEAVLLENGTAKVKRHAVGNGERFLVRETIGPFQQHDLAETCRGLFVEHFLETNDIRNRGLRDGGLVIALFIYKLRLLPRLPRQLSSLRVKRHCYGIAGNSCALPLHYLRGAVRFQIDDLFEVAVVANFVFREVRFGHLVDLVHRDCEIIGGANAEIVNDAMRLMALRILCPDAHLVVADRELAEVELVIAASKVCKCKNLRLAALEPELEKRREAMRLVEKANLCGVKVGHEETNLHVVARRDSRLHIVSGDVRIFKTLWRLIALIAFNCATNRGWISEVSGNKRLCISNTNNAERGNAREHSKEQFFRVHCRFFPLTHDSLAKNMLFVQ